MSTISIDGLISNMDTSEMVDQLIAVQRLPANQMAAKQAGAQKELLAFQSLNASVLSLKAAMYGMSSTTALAGRTASSSNESILTASASSTAASGTYSLQVNSLAQSHQIATQGLADADSTRLGTGDFTITIGTGSDAVTTSITIDDTNNTLAGLSEAINNSDADVTAFVVNTGVGDTPYQLVISSNETGSANTLWIESSLSGGTAPDFFATDPGVPTVDLATWTGTSTPSVDGTYTGRTDKTYTFTVQDLEGQPGEVGSDADPLIITWDDGEGNTGQLDLGTTYTPGSAVTFADGLTVSFDAGQLGSLESFTVDATAATLNTTQAAQDASVSIGSDAGGGTPITVTSSTNTVRSLIPGVTLDLLSTDTDTPITVTVANNTASVKSQIQGFVAAYNSVNELVQSYTAYDPDTQAAGILLGNSAVMRVENELTAIVGTLVAGQPDGFGALASIGISYSETGNLVVDSGRLGDALDDNFDAVGDLFRMSGQSSHTRVSFIGADDETIATSAGYDVNITQAATNGHYTTASITDPASTPLVIDETNNEFRISVNDDVSEVLTLTQGTYTSGDALADEIQARINGAEETRGDVTVTWVDEGGTGYLKIESTTYGSDSNVTIGASPDNSAHSILGFDTGTSTDGLDVAGTINGESATGRGQLLIGDDGNANTAELKLLVELDASDLGDGAEASVTVTKGIAVSFNERLERLTDSIDGVLTQRTESLQEEIDSLAQDIADFDDRLEVRRERLMAQFAAQEGAIAKIQQQGEYVLNSLTINSRDDK